MKIVKKQEKVKRLVDLRRRVVKDLCPGELVIVRRKLKKKNKTKKLLPKYVGPYQVVKKVCPTTYLVENLPARRKKKFCVLTRVSVMFSHVCILVTTVNRTNVLYYKGQRVI
jgi:hypothetical protein